LDAAITVVRHGRSKRRLLIALSRKLERARIKRNAGENAASGWQALSRVAENTDQAFM
jgi:hypothetical protein